jgi:hypothetical protein
MPIRFPCPHCQQKLSVSSRKAGTKAHCPRCHKELTIPEQKTAVSSAGAPDQAAASADDEEDDPYSQFVVYDETELVYEQAEAATPRRASPPHAVPDRVAVPRLVIYTQGALLGLVALASLVLGVLLGGTFYSAPPLAGQPCTISGTVRYAVGGQSKPDAGAVVIVLPQTKDPGRRVPTDGLRPEEPLPEAPLAAAEEIRNMGGAYTRADDQGRFQVQLPSSGKYYVLVLSRHLRRLPSQDVNTQDLVRIARFVEDASDLLADSRYQFTTETILGDRELSAVFD